MCVARVIGFTCFEFGLKWSVPRKRVERYSEILDVTVREEFKLPDIMRFTVSDLSYVHMFGDIAMLSS